MARSIWSSVVAAALVATAPAALAERARSIEHNDTKGQVIEQYRYNLAPCEALYGDERTACREEAKAVRKREEARAEALHEKALAEAATAQELGDKELEIQRTLALERCEAMAASDQATCRNDVRIRFGR
jgi:hypothetical protein